MAKDEDIIDLHKWLKKDGNSKALLAIIMGFETTSVIDKWIGKGKVPAHRRSQLRDALNKGVKVSDIFKAGY